jgi:alpha-1,6-mannosyltransferase
VGVRLVKLIALIATALTAGLIFGAARPTARARAFSAFWWNPVVIIEGAGEGHNDAVMVAAVVLSIWCLHRRADVAAAAALAAAVLTKWIPALLVPAYLAYAWRNGRVTRRTACQGSAVVAALTAAAYFPLWAGTDTFAGIRSATGPRFVASTTGVFVNLLGDYPFALDVLRVCAASVLLVAVIRTTRQTRTVPELIKSSAAIVLAYVLIAAPLYWPWYVLMPIALLALADDIPFVIVLTMASRIVAPLNVIRSHDGLSGSTQVWVTTAVGLWLPMAYLAWRSVSQRRTTIDSPQSSDH